MAAAIDFTFNTQDQNIWFTSDTHFGHYNIIKYTGRPFKTVEEMDETLIKNWNDRVKPGDIIFHLGDFGNGGSDKIKQVLTRLNGKKFMILGNHDRKTFRAGHSQHFQAITQQMYIRVNGRAVYLNHYPFLCFAGTYRKPEDMVWQLFGHVHSGPLNNNSADSERLKYLWPTQYDVGVDNNNFCPVSWSEICEIINEKLRTQNS